MNNLVYINYQLAKPLISEADILLFRGSGLAASFIRRASEGLYTHIGVASWHNQNLECVEFREWKGGRTTRLSRQIEQHNGLIDVYRIRAPQPQITFNEKTHAIYTSVINFHPEEITECMRAMTGLPYGWSRILWIALHKLPILRFFYSIKSVVKDSDIVVYPVCSTAIAACFSTCGYDLVHNRSDQWTEPSDIARSTLLQYLFTLTLDKTKK